MQKRIRYTKTNKPDEIKSVQNFVGQQKAQYKIFINTKEKTYRIKNMNTKLILRSTEKDNKKIPKNLYTVYEQAKKALKTLGVNFDSEFRGL